MGIEKLSSHRRVLAPGQAAVFNRGIKHLALIAALAALASCASPPTAHAPDSDLAFALGHDLVCDASDMTQSPGEPMTLHISLEAPDRGGEGRFCIATGCEDATFEPAFTRALGWTATMRTNDRTNYDANLEIARDLRTFTLTQTESHAVMTWTGTCNAAGS